ncbi:MAG TPA: transposase [Polyangiaceae bacterium]|nr:transposase [Polyangiaceae bacterium]
MPPKKADPEQSAKKRRDAIELRETKLETEITPIPVPPGHRTCPACGNRQLRRVGKGKASTVFEYVQPHFRKRIYQRETLACRCGHIVTAPGPERVGDKTRYAASFVAHLIVNKCDDSFPQYRLEKYYRRLGIPISRSTMCDLLHRGAEELRPLHAAALAMVPKAADVHADETSIRQLGLPQRAFRRSGKTPEEVLGDSTGRLVVDQFTGYNAVTKPSKRLRAECLAHARRKIFEQREHPETQEALDLIGEICRVDE